MSKRSMLLGCVSAFVLSACATPQNTSLPASGNPDDLLIIDCLLPGQVRQLGTKITFLSPRRPIKTSAARCEISGGEYVAFDRADAGTSLKIWLPQAESGDPQAQTYVGEIFEKGLGVEPDYQVAVRWYQKAALQGYTRAQINLGYLYESGLGVTQDLSEAMNLYRQASGIEEGSLEYVSTVEFTRRETAKRDTAALRSRVRELAEQLADSEERYRSVREQMRIDQVELQDLSDRTEAKRLELASTYENDDSATLPATAKALLEIDALRKQLASEQMRDNDLAEQLNASRAEVAALRTSVSKLEQSSNGVPASTLSDLNEAEQRELALVRELTAQTASLNALKSRQLELEKQYQQSIENLQSELELSIAEQTRVAGRLADSDLIVREVQIENKLLRDRLREQNADVAQREQEQRRLSAKVATLSLSEQASQAEKRAAEAATRAANAELALARFEQSRLVTKLVEAQLNTQQSNPDTALQLAILEKQLSNQRGVVNKRQQQIAVLEQDVTEAQAQAQSRPAEEVAQVVAVGPTIEIIEPLVLLTRGPGEIVASRDGTVDLIGRVTPSDNLLTFAINGQRQTVNSAGIFNFRSVQALSSIQLTAVDDNGERASVSFSVTKSPENSVANVIAGQSSSVRETYKDIDFGRYHAIVIGNNKYEELTDLRTAEADARTIDQLLRNQYGFTTQLLINATRLDILTALTAAKEKLTETDNLIVYYAGHGQIDPDGERGYWLPVDATASNTDQWISNAVVTNFLDSIPAKQIMVVADSCFSGTLTKASIPRMQETMPAALRKQWLSLMAKRKVRTVLSSGGVKPVYDGTTRHSLFATAFIEQLSRNQGVLAGHRLYADIRDNVQQSANALGVDQVPQYAAAKYAGHEVGEFLFVSR